MKMGLPELIFASYSWARRLHMVRLTRERPRRVISAVAITLRVLSRLRPETSTFCTGTLRIILSLAKSMTKTLRSKPAIS